MKIVFICGSLEPGRDGVGDYTRRLGKSVMSLGHQIGLVALNERDLIEKYEGTQTEDKMELPVLRLPFLWSNKKKLKNAKKWIDEINPDWLSLQYVIYSFHDKGLPIYHHRYLKSLGVSRKWHIMFHELWIGMATNDKIKRKIWGKMQKIIICRLIEALHPKVIHTHCNLYVEQLKKSSYPIRKLSLFSNIDVMKTTFKPVDKLFSTVDCEHIVRFALFGGLQPDAALLEFVLTLNNVKKSTGKTFEFFYLGRNGRELNNHIKLLEQENIKYKVFGELNPGQISSLLSVCSFGLTTGSIQMLDKNGTVAAMLEHGLPVICIGRNLIYANIPSLGVLKGVHFQDDLPQLLSVKQVINFTNTLSNITDKYLQDLQSSS